MKKIATCFLLSILSVIGLSDEKPTPVQPVKAPLAEGDELFFEEEVDLEEEDLEGFEEG